jgi:hypothetical protein
MKLKQFSNEICLSAIAVLIICITASYSIVYSNIQNFVVSKVRSNDTSVYLDMYENVSFGSYQKCRILVPFLVRLLPDFPKDFFSEDRDMSKDYWMARIKFGMVNFCFLVGCGFILFYFLKNYGFNTLESITGTLMFYTARPVIQEAGASMVEASAYFFLILCLYAIKKENILMFCIGFSIGLFAKESVFLVLFLLLFSNTRFKLKFLYSVIPVILAYLWFRHSVVKFECFLEMNHFSEMKHKLYGLTHLNNLLDLFSSFGMLWFPAIFALKYKKLPKELYSYCFLVPFLFIIIVFFGLTLGRALFMAFPVVIPLALFGLRKILDMAK